MMMMFDPLGIMLMIIGGLITAAAQFKVKSTFARYSQVGARRGVTADRVARALLDRFGLTSVEIKRVGGQLTDHYDPRDRSLALSDSVYGSNSIAAIGVAAHEVGHAIQHNIGYSPLVVRNTIVPVVNIGSSMAMPVLFMGVFFQAVSLVNIGILLFLGVVVFHLITLPVEFNASSRAVTILRQTGVLEGQELDGASRVLNAAALTYVATTLVAVMNLIWLLVRSRD